MSSIKTSICDNRREKSFRVCISPVFKSAAIGALFAFWFFPMPLQAAGLGGYELERFEARIAVHQDGVVDIEETIAGNFLESRHGIFRYLPVRYAGADGGSFSIRLKVAEVTRYDAYEEFHVQEPYEIFRQGAFAVIKIGQPRRVHEGPFEYKIRYQADNVLLFHDIFDEFYWNVTGHDWDVPLGQVKATVAIEGLKDLRQAKLIDCFVGEPGENQRKCIINNARHDQVGFAAEGPLTVQIRFPKAYVNEPGTWKRLIWWLNDNWDWLLLAIPLAVFGFLFRAWRYHGRDAKGRGVVAVEYQPPVNLRPTELGTLWDAKVHARDFSAAIVDLAVRGHFQIIEDVRERLGPDKKTYRFRKLPEPADELKLFEKQILQAIFGDEQEAEFSNRAAALARAREETAVQVYADMAQQGFFVKNPRTARLIYMGLGIGIAILGHVMGLIAYSVLDRPVAHIAFFATAGLFLLFAPFMPKRTEKGAVALDLAKGFKMFLETAEKYRLEWQEKEGIFEKYLPYAIVLGVADKWAKALAVQAGQNAPAWYVASAGQTFSALDFAGSVSSFANTAAKAAAPSSSGRDGGGSGFSGGGFGGGGGGSW